jgi:hypothetical protein
MVLLLVVLVGIGLLAAFNWLVMAASFLFSAAAGEKRELAWLRLKLGALTRIARGIGESERRIGEIEDWK